MVVQTNNRVKTTTKLLWDAFGLGCCCLAWLWGYDNCFVTCDVTGYIAAECTGTTNHSTASKQLGYFLAGKVRKKTRILERTGASNLTFLPVVFKPLPTPRDLKCLPLLL